MATTFEFVISCPASRLRHAESVLASAHQEVDHLEEELSEYRESSAVFRLNRAQVGEVIETSQATEELFMIADRLKDLSGNCFSYVSKSTPEALALKTPLVQRMGNRIQRLHPGARVGFGAIGKGYALDRVRALIEREGFSDFLLSAGGSSIIFSGFSAEKIPWSWAWSWKKNEHGARLGLNFQHWSGRPVALGISGTDEKGDHIIDPRVSQRTSSSSSLKSALVACSSAASADAWSTALFVGGWEELQKRSDDLVEKPALAAIDQEEIPCWNGVFQSFWGGITTAVFFVFAFVQNALAVVAEEKNGSEQSVDLSALGMDTFNPYIYERDLRWVILPVFTLVVILIHLKKRRSFDQLK